MNHISAESCPTVFVFLPDSLDIGGRGNLRGFYKKEANTFNFYITDDRLHESTLEIIGYCSDITPLRTCLDGQAKWIHVQPSSGQITACGFNSQKITIVRYNYQVFLQSDLAGSCLPNDAHFKRLVEAIHSSSLLDTRKLQENNDSYLLKVLGQDSLRLVLLLLHWASSLVLRLFRQFNALLKFSATALHFKDTFNTIRWICEAKLSKRRVHQQKYAECHRKISLSITNVIVARGVDFLCGVCVLYFVQRYRLELTEAMRDTTNSIISGLEQLMHFLMGSPAGLKLNKAFNGTLGTFFLHHISLWKAFLQATAPFLSLGLRLTAILGTFGLSFQAAIVSDLVTFSTFHVYCIYVYAARLYSVQVKALMSLWRLFIGRKYNPLRQRVDSHEYDLHQLFVGTLSFTILLFLFPTTSLYYIVFTVFRIGMVTVYRILIQLRYVLQSLPLYVVTLWLINSPRIKGTIQLSIQDDKKYGEIVNVTLQALSLKQCISNGCPHDIIDAIPPISYSEMLQSVLKGALL